MRDGLNLSGPLGLALFALVAALAEAEVEALRERTKAGLAVARAKGRRIGRPAMGSATLEQILTLKVEGLPQHVIAIRLGVSRAYVSRALKRMGSPPEFAGGLPQAS